MAAPLRHTVPCYGYVIKEKPRPGAMRVDKLEEFNIPRGPIRQTIKESSVPVKLPDGRVVRRFSRAIS
jgi:ribonuclease Z